MDTSCPIEVLLCMWLILILISFCDFLCVCALILSTYLIRLLWGNVHPHARTVQVLHAYLNPEHCFLSFPHFSQDRAEHHARAPAIWPVSAHGCNESVLVPAGDAHCLSQLWPPTRSSLWFQGLPEHCSSNEFKFFANVGRRHSRLYYKMKGKSESHSGSQRKAQKRPSRAETGTYRGTARICIISHSPKPCNEAFRIVFLNFSTGTVFMDYLNIKIDGFLEKNHFSL